MSGQCYRVSLLRYDCYGFLKLAGREGNSVALFSGLPNRVEIFGSDGDRFTFMIGERSWLDKRDGLRGFHRWQGRCDCAHVCLG